MTTETREPTALEVAETDVTSAVADAVIEAVDSVESAAQRAFNAAADGVDSQTWRAITYLALRLCGQQMRRTLTDGIYEPATDSFVFKTMLFERAKDGGMIWRGTESDVLAIKEARGNARKELLAAYVNAKGQKLVQGLEHIRTYGFRLASFMRDNHAAAMVECARAETPKDALERWAKLVGELFGASFSQLAHNLDSKLAPEKAAKAEARKAKKEAEKAEAETRETAEKAEAFARMDHVGVIMATVQGLNAADFDRLMFAIKAEAMARNWSPAPPAPEAEGETVDGTATEVVEPLRIAA